MAETLRQLGMDRTRARKGAVRPELTPSQIRGLLADVATGGGVPFIDAASQATQGNYGQAAISGLLDAPPVKMAGMALAPLIGMVRKSAPMDEALRIAQKNAAKPVSEGGLGLPPDNTPMDRARAMGFDVDFQHGTKSGDIYYIDESKLQQSDPGYLGKAFYGGPVGMSAYTGGGVVYPLTARTSKMQKITPENWNLNSPYTEVAELLANSKDKKLASAEYSRKKRKSGITGIVDTSGSGNLEQIAIYDPSVVRSRFAAFDPVRINENNLLASLAALGISIPVMRGLLQEEVQ